MPFSLFPFRENPNFSEYLGWIFGKDVGDLENKSR
jgi:hypothetical protein